MARRKSQFGGGFPNYRMPPLPKLPKMPKLPRRRDWDDDDDYDDDDDPQTRDREEEERDRAYYESPEGIAERKTISDRKKYTWDAMLMIWVTRPYEVMKYLFNRLFKYPPNTIGIWHLISVVLWVILIWIILELYLVWEKIPFYAEYIVNRGLILMVIIIGSYFYCRIKARLKVQ